MGIGELISKILYSIIAAAFVGGLFAPAFAGDPSSDFGDAPDNGAPTQYAGVFAQNGNFPTLLANNGARVADTTIVKLGLAVTNEADANPIDGADDGLDGMMIILVSIPPPAVISLTATSTVTDTYFLNVLIDQNLSGEWGDNSGGTPEWVVANQAVGLVPGDNKINPPPFPFGFGNRLPDGAWMRVSLTKEAVTPDPVKGWLGDGSFTSGEIEDYRLVLGTTNGQKRSAPVIDCGAPTKDFGGAASLNFNCKITNMGGDGDVRWSFMRLTGGVKLSITGGVPPGDIANGGPGALVNGKTTIPGALGTGAPLGGMVTLAMKADKFLPLPSLWKVTVRDGGDRLLVDGYEFGLEGENMINFVDSTDSCCPVQVSGHVSLDNGPAVAPLTAYPFRNIPIGCLDDVPFVIPGLPPFDQDRYALPDGNGDWQMRVPNTTLRSCFPITENHSMHRSGPGVPIDPTTTDPITNVDFTLFPSEPGRTHVTYCVDGDSTPNGCSAADHPIPDGWIGLDQKTHDPIRAAERDVTDALRGGSVDTNGHLFYPASMRHDGTVYLYGGLLGGRPLVTPNEPLTVVDPSPSTASSVSDSRTLPESWENIGELVANIAQQNEVEVSSTECPGNDPSGDTFVPAPIGFANHDICDIKAEYDAVSGNLVFEIMTASPFTNPWDSPTNGLTGFIDIDVDKNPATGPTSFYSGLSGVEFTIAFFNPFFGTQAGYAQILESNTGAPIYVPIMYGTNTMTLEMDPCVFGGQAFNYYASSTLPRTCW